MTGSTLAAAIVCALGVARGDLPGQPDPKMPTRAELLDQPISLTGLCSTVKIVEWRPTPGKEATTSPSPDAIHAVDDICNQAVAAFEPFVHEQGYITVHPLDGFHHRLSLMPADVHDHGLDPRNLNDTRERFAHRRVPDRYVWGLTTEEERMTFMDNGVLAHPDLFRDIFTHEMFHALSMFSGTYRMWNDEEALARRFETYLEGTE
jgi:hypothetical protein